jgi:DNA repair exonuclease SbcCD ATPase subunit
MNLKQIIITFITLITLIGIGWYCYNKFKPTTPNSTNEPIDTIEEDDDEIQKIEPTPIEKPQPVETPKPVTESKIPISQARFDEIKNYILSLDDNLLPKNLNPNEKTKIEEIRTPIKSAIQNSQLELAEYEKIIIEIQNKLKNINDLNIKLHAEEDAIKGCNGEIERKEDELSKTQDIEKREQLQKKINQVKDQRAECIQQTIYTKKEIKDENEKHYDNMLKNAEDSKQQLVKNFETLKSNNEKSVIDELKKIYQIVN